MPRAKRVPALHRYLGGAGLTRLAVEGNATALVLLVLARTGEPRTAGIMVAAMLTPSLVVGPISGTVLDRARHRRLVYIASLLVLAGCLVSLTLVVESHLTASALLVAVVAGCTLPVVSGGLSSVVPELSGDRPPHRAFGMDSIAYGIASVAGPAVAALVAARDPGMAVSLCGGLVGLGTLLIASLPLASRRPAAGFGPMRQLRDGLRAMVASRPLAVATLSSTVAFAGFGAVPLAAALAAAATGRPAAQGGLAVSAFAAGALLSSVGVTMAGTVDWRPERVVLASLAATGTFLGLAGAMPRFTWLVAVFAVAGLCNGPGLVSLFSIRATSSPALVRTQVFTTGASLKGAAAAAGVAAGGAAAERGSALLLLGIGLAHVLGACAGLLLCHGHRTASAAAGHVQAHRPSLKPRPDVSRGGRPR